MFEWFEYAWRVQMVYVSANAGWYAAVIIMMMIALVYMSMYESTRKELVKTRETLALTREWLKDAREGELKALWTLVENRRIR
jgi:hypothetical protein